MNETICEKHQAAHAEKWVENEHVDMQKCSFGQCQALIFQIASLFFLPSLCTRSESLPQTHVSHVTSAFPYMRINSSIYNELGVRQN